MNIKVRRIGGFVLPATTRMPFRFGIVEMTEVPQLFVRADVEVDGGVHRGMAGEGLVPKWFTKNPDTSIEDDRAQMVAVVARACESSVELEPAPSVFALWSALDDVQRGRCAADDVPPLLAGLGTSLVERAVIDAVCRADGTSFAAAVREDLFALRLEDVHAELRGATVAELLPVRPRERLLVRHTVGLSDPLTDVEISPDDELQDGLPQSLEACVDAYRLERFKIKLCGDDERDLDRLRSVVSLLEQRAPAGWRFSLDGNEQYDDIAAFRGFWDQATSDRSLAPAFGRLLFVEQPLRRDKALEPDAARVFLAWPERPPLVIDESDATTESLPVALARGYAGTSVKSCKGVLRGIANACLVETRRRNDPDRDAVVTAEDLTTVGPLALLQDLALVSTLGLEHVERNGHHYFAGLSMFPVEVQERVLRHHPDLYTRARGGYATLLIRDGAIDVGSVVAAPYGTATEVEPSSFAEPAFTFE